MNYDNQDVFTGTAITALWSGCRWGKNMWHIQGGLRSPAFRQGILRGNMH